MSHEYSPGITSEGTAAINAVLREGIIDAVHKLDTIQGEILGDVASYTNCSRRYLNRVAAQRIQQLDAERRKMIGWLKDHGGLPSGMTEVY